MNDLNNTITPKDLGNAACRLVCFPQLTHSNSNELREIITRYSVENYKVIYLNLQDVNEMDLCGVNEVIQSYFRLRLTQKKLVLIYREDSIVDHWVQNTGLHRFVETSILA